MNWAALIGQSRQTFSEFWAGRDARERAMLGMAALVAIFGLIYALLVDPALSGRARLSKDLPLLRLQVAQMQALANQAAALSSQPSSPLPPLSKQDIETALAQYGLKPQNVLPTGDSVKVLLANSSFTGIIAWLDQMQKSARISVVDADIVALPQPDMANASFTLRQPSHD